jgi:hypothetical protein
MSWQATAWAIKQATGSTRRKALLLALAYYADPNGECWPSQERLAVDTEQSVDSVQRHSASLEKMRLIERKPTPKRRGQYVGYRYRLAMPVPSSAAAAADLTKQSLRFGRAAKYGQTRPQSLRLKPSIEPSYEHPNTKSLSEQAEARLRAFQDRQEPLEVIQHRIAQRIGDDGWLVLGDMNDNQRQRLSKLERQGKLDEETLRNAVLAARCTARP